jgi:hypothetical protein
MGLCAEFSFYNTDPRWRSVWPEASPDEKGAFPVSQLLILVGFSGTLAAHLALSGWHLSNSVTKILEKKMLTYLALLTKCRFIKKCSGVIIFALSGIFQI